MTARRVLDQPILRLYAGPPTQVSKIAAATLMQLTERRAQPAEHIASHPPLSAPFPAAHRIPHPARRNATQRVRVWAPRSTPTLHLACAEPARTPSCSAALADAENLQPRHVVADRSPNPRTPSARPCPRSPPTRSFYLCAPHSLGLLGSQRDPRSDIHADVCAAIDRVMGEQTRVAAPAHAADALGLQQN